MTLLIGERYKEKYEEALAAQSIDVIWVPDNGLFDTRLAGHVDLSIFRAEKRIFVSKGCSLSVVKELTSRGYDCISVSGAEGEKYPSDAKLCICDTGKYLLYNAKTADPDVIACFQDRIHINVAQGYTRCAVCAVTDDAVITTDNGIAWTARLRGLEVLKIRNDTIQLPGFDEGFIGGASVKISDDHIIFFGNLERHPDCRVIHDFLRKKRVKYSNLGNEPLMDIGGAIALP